MHTKIIIENMCSNPLRVCKKQHICNANELNVILKNQLDI